MRRRSGVVAALAGTAVLAAVASGPTTPAFAQLQSQAPVAGAPLTFADIVEKVKPAVVSIRVSSGSARLADRSQNRGSRPRGNGAPFPDLPPDHPLNEFFKNMPRNFGGAPSPRQRRRRAQGSGFVISEDGFVVTNNHVIKGGNEITVVFDEKNKYDAELVGADPRTDLALLKIKSSKKFPYVKFTTKKSRVGDWVVAVGNPFGLGGTVTAGILSAQGRDIGSGPYDFIQIDAAVNRGNSGGPTFNLDGEVIGVNTAIYSPSGGNVGIAFAVPARTTIEVIEQLKNKGTVSRGWLGVKIQSVTEDMAASLGLDEAQGALISEVNADGPAKTAGLRAGDAILMVDDAKIEDSRDLARKIAAYSPGSTVRVKVRRANGDRTINVKLGTFPNDTAAAAKPKPPAAKAKPTALKDLGLGLVAATGGNGGVAIESVDAGSDASEKDLRTGDIIVEVNGEPVARPADVDRAVQAAKKLGRKAVLITVKRGDNRRFVAVQLKAKG
ncbi:MAG: Do family serine endopeptidase [Hyphomicrobiaceae bacterium]